MKAQQKKIRDELLLQLAQYEKGIQEISIMIKEKNILVSNLGNERKKLKSFAENVRQTLANDHVHLELTDHAIVQYLRRVRPNLLKEISNDIFADKTIERKKIGNVITTVFEKSK